MEKSIKAITAALASKQYAEFTIQPDHDVSKSISALRRLCLHGKGKEIQGRIRSIIEFRRSEIAQLSKLAPKWASAGQLFSRNTEYPFQRSSHSWTTPSQSGVFSAQEAEGFRELARSVYVASTQIVSAILRSFGV
ncbi:MAG: hypothetical protein NTW86_18945 [Candidatus Sumerlaeota bacterium]|nr:hypothetical protein [Candidatus Sumerlaeota bacterium]